MAAKATSGELKRLLEANRDFAHKAVELAASAPRVPMPFGASRMVRR